MRALNIMPQTSSCFTQHQHQRHAGEMIEGEAPAEEDPEARATEPEQPPPEAAPTHEVSAEGQLSDVSL